MTESPAELLRRAAAKIERLAAVAPLWPWRMGGSGDLLGYGSVPIVQSGYDFAEVQWADGVFEWVCPMSPAVAAPLVEWLRAEAEHAATTRVRAWQAMQPHTARAVAFARAVLGENTEDPS